MHEPTNIRNERFLSICEFLHDIGAYQPHGYRFIAVGKSAKLLSYEYNDVDRMEALVEKYLDEELYFAPLSYRRRAMKTEYALPTMWLWNADVDVDAPMFALPNIVIANSRNSHSAMWGIDRHESPERAEAMNQVIGKRDSALLRVPYSRHQGNIVCIVGDRRKEPTVMRPRLATASLRSAGPTTGRSGSGPVVKHSATARRAGDEVARLLARYGDARSKKGVSIKRYYEAGHESSARYALAMTLGESGATREDIVALCLAAGGDRSDAERLASKAVASASPI